MAMRRVLWLSDIHLEFLERTQIESFANELAEAGPDVLLISGDIGTAKNLPVYLTFLARRLVAPVYFVLGNHDFYGSDIPLVRSEMVQLTHARSGAVWLPEAGVVELAPGVGLVGHDGWADGRFGDYLRSTLISNDYTMIDSLRLPTPQARWQRVQQLSNESADYLRRVIPQAAEQYKQVIILTHVPPFQEGLQREGKLPAPDNPLLPHVTSKAAGEVLLEMALAYPNCDFTVLCGHTHNACVLHVMGNLTVHVAGARYGRPVIQQAFTFLLLPT